MQTLQLPSISLTHAGPHCAAARHRRWRRECHGIQKRKPCLWAGYGSDLGIAPESSAEDEDREIGSPAILAKAGSGGVK